MRRFAVVLATLALLITLVVPAHAITFGEPDGNDHPYVGVMIFEVAGELYLCSGSLLSETVFLTAAHCTAGATAAWISFDERPDYDSFPVNWIEAESIIPHPGYDDFASFPNIRDIGIVILSEPVELNRYAELPSLGFLDRLATRRGRQNVTFTVVGYGVNSYKPRAIWEGNRYQATSRLINLRSALTDGFNLMTTNNPGNGRGGTCSGDSGGPFLYGNSDVIVAVNSFGIAPYCKGNDYAYRVDIAESLNFILPILEAETD